MKFSLAYEILGQAEFFVTKSMHVHSMEVGRGVDHTIPTQMP
ncbi:MAG: hypothetical protein ACYCYE_11690 [Clostridia bacterium]